MASAAICSSGCPAETSCCFCRSPGAAAAAATKAATTNAVANMRMNFSILGQRRWQIASGCGCRLGIGRSAYMDLLQPRRSENESSRENVPGATLVKKACAGCRRPAISAALARHFDFVARPPRRLRKGKLMTGKMVQRVWELRRTGDDKCGILLNKQN